MADSLRGHLVPLVLCCVSGGVASVQTQAALAASLPPLQVDPSLLTAATLLPAAGRVTDTPPTHAVFPQPGKASEKLVSPQLPPNVPFPEPAAGSATRPELALSPRLSAPKAMSSRTSFISGEQIQGGDAGLTIKGQAEMRQLGKILTADQISYFYDTDEVEAEGQVRLVSGGSSIVGPYMKRKVDEATGIFDHPDYVLRSDPQPGQPIPSTTGYGHAEKLAFEGEDRYRLINTRYTTCQASNPDWYTQSDELILDYGQMVGEGKNTKIVFKDTPIFYSPTLGFSLNNARKSGFLTPTMGTSSTSGLDVTLPYYWNIAPNMDATFTPRMLVRRGVQLGSEFRYLEPTFDGAVRYEFLPNDRVFGANRSSYSLSHRQTLGQGFLGQLDLNGVSDYRYFADLGTRVTATAQTTLLRQGALVYNSNWWTTRFGVQRYQTLQDPVKPTSPPYDRLPYLTLSGSRPAFLGGTTFSFNGSYDQFAVADPTNANRPEGQRVVAYPRISLPMVFSGLTVTPQLGYHISHYNLSKVAAAGDATLFSRKQPIFSLDSTLTLERDLQWGGQDMIQTLEPRLYYLYVPARDQSRIPVFDSGRADFNFAQIFSENAYAGNDRIADANQLTAVITSRLIDSQTGGQVLKTAVGQRYYFSNQTVTLPSETPRTSKNADVLAAVTGTLSPGAYLDSAWQYNPHSHQTQRFTVGGRYQPEALRVLNMSYRFRRDSIQGADDGLRDFDLSGQWPLMGRWYGLTRYNYSLHDKRLVEGLFGAEYDGGCWVGRLVMQRFATTSLTSTTTLFFQLELNGFSRIGSDPGEVLRRSITGYGRVNVAHNAPLFGIE